ncbi:MAG: NAD(P)/FAD-dependent oxidoreductase, partial [Candidatus Aminicenantes bacterium]|nr:NAD(P)/FAD-dependent oxidoreductase [Candidatus Aminicenantes bacterium]
MRVIIAGNGLAGTMVAKTVRELDSSAEIKIFSEESYHYYPRPNMIDFLSGLLPLEKVFAFPSDWVVRQKIELNLNRRLLKLELEKQQVVLDGEENIPFDYLVLATGSVPFAPPVKGLGKSGVFYFRTLDDALNLIDYLQFRPEVVILGGGLLGLEIAKALRTRGLEKVTVVEVYDRLLPRQLDPEAASLLRRKLEEAGINFMLGRMVEEIIGDGSVSGVRFQDGEIKPAGVVIIASGVRPRAELAAESGLKINRGIVVDDYLKTSHPRVLAAGDVAEHRGKVYGLIPAAFEQARVLAYNLCGQVKRYEGTISSSTLKVAGVYVTSIGLVIPEGDEFEILVKREDEAGIYKRLVLKKNVCVGAIWMGTKKNVQEVARLIQSGLDISHFKKDILE